MPESHDASNYDEVSMQQSMLFSDGLQVYSDNWFKSPSELEGGWLIAQTHSFYVWNQYNSEMIINGLCDWISKYCYNVESYLVFQNLCRLIWQLNERLSALFSSQDLKNLRAQLYSAAEYFELSYTTDDKKQMWVSIQQHFRFIEIVLFISIVVSHVECRVVETLKDYAVKALVNTVDHLGSVTYKVNDFIDEKVDEVSETELRVSCIEQVYPKTCMYP